MSEEDGFLSCCAPLFSSPRHIVHAQDFGVRESASEGQQRIGAELDSRQVTVPHGREQYPWSASTVFRGSNRVVANCNGHETRFDAA